MKLIIFISIIFSFPFDGQGQSNFQLKSNVGSGIEITVNGISYTLDSTYTKVKTNYPVFDTLVFISESPNGQTATLCNFKPDSSYAIILACCGSLDLVPGSKLMHDSLQIWYDEYEQNFPKIQSLLMDSPSFTLTLINGGLNDSIYCWYADAACFTRFKILDNIGWEYGVPEKCFYWNNISDFVFFKSDTDYSDLKNEYGEIDSAYPNDSDMNNVLGHISVRLFDNHKFLISYNVLTNEVFLKYND